MVRKVAIRSQISRETHRANIYLAGCGFGLMFRNVWREKAQYTLALDTCAAKVKDFAYHFPAADIRCADATKFSEWPPGILFQIADFDTFGDPYPLVRAFFQAGNWMTPLIVVVGDSKLLHFKRAGIVPPELWKRSRRGIYRGLRDAETYVDRLVWPWWARLALKNQLTIKERSVAFNRGKTVAYYGLHFEHLL